MTEEQLLDYNRCKEDFIYFINKYTYFYKYSPLLADFKLYNFQEEVLRAVNESSSVIINSARQMGITTILMGYALWKCNFTPNYKVRLMNVSTVSGIRQLEIFRDSYERLPDYIKTPCEFDNKRKIKMGNESSIAVVPSLSTLAADMIVIDNASFISGLSELLYDKKSYPCSKMVVASTLYKEGWFAEMCKLAEESSTSFTYIKLPYWKHPKRDRLWRSNISKEIGEDSAVIEYDCTHYYDRRMKPVPLIKD